MEQIRDIVCPECAAGKCHNCDSTAWDFETDEPCACSCTHISAV